MCIMHNLASAAFRWETFANKVLRADPDRQSRKCRNDLCQATNFATLSGESGMRLVIVLAMVLF